MAADNQMDPEDLAALVVPVARGEVEYAKANRFFTGRAWELIPRHRYLGNAALSLLTKIASGLGNGITPRDAVRHGVEQGLALVPERQHEAVPRPLEREGKRRDSR